MYIYKTDSWSLSVAVNLSTELKPSTCASAIVPTVQGLALRQIGSDAPVCRLSPLFRACVMKQIPKAWSCIHFSLKLKQFHLPRTYRIVASVCIASHVRAPRLWARFKTLYAIKSKIRLVFGRNTPVVLDSPQRLFFKAFLLHWINENIKIQVATDRGF